MAPALLGLRLVRDTREGRSGGIIVETEAYGGPADRASHARAGLTRRTAPMFGPPGHAYVYLIYGVHHCMNVVTEPEGKAAAVLIRALEPVRDIEGSTKGPGLLCRAMGIDRTLNGVDLLGDTLFLAEPEVPDTFEIVARPRIGVGYAGEWAEKPLRFLIGGNAWVSKK